MHILYNSWIIQVFFEHNSYSYFSKKVRVSNIKRYYVFTKPYDFPCLFVGIVTSYIKFYNTTR